MMFNREEAALRAAQAKTNKPGTCQLWTRTMFDAPSAGDQDSDGDSDAVDGWKSEPVNKRHTDRNPPRGVPVAFSGGSRGFGHRAISLGHGKIRSTDMTANGYEAGVVGTTTIEQIEKSMGVKYLGWSETITGVQIPLAPAPNHPQLTVKKTSRGANVDAAIKEADATLKSINNALRASKGPGRLVLLTLAQKRIRAAIKSLERIQFVK